MERIQRYGNTGNDLREHGKMDSSMHDSDMILECGSGRYNE